MINKLLEIHDLITEFEKSSKKQTNILIKQQNEGIISSLKKDWEVLAKAQYPMILNEKEKLVNIRTIIREIKVQEKKLKRQQPAFKEPSLNDILNRVTNDFNLVTSLYDKDFVSDVPDPYRKRRKP